MHILILDNNKLFAVGIKYLLEALLSGTQADYTTSYAEAADLLRTARFALLVMEIGIAKDNGLRVLKRLRSEYPNLPLLVLSNYPADYYGPRVIRAGACGFIEKDSEPEQVLWAVQCVLKGKHYINPELADQLVLGLVVGPNKGLPHERLSSREIQVFRRLALGQSVTCIGRSLKLSVKTVDTNLDDTTTGGSNIAGADYTLNSGSPIEMEATDGSFDSEAEDVTATIYDGLLVGFYDFCVTDKDSADNTGSEECTFLPVYDPSGGFVTGGGWIDSPAGSYTADPALTGKAKFGFVSKYKKGPSRRPARHISSLLRAI
jgi:DNA-binding NarL/FixJ family response regulator